MSGLPLTVHSHVLKSQGGGQDFGMGRKVA